MKNKFSWIIPVLILIIVIALLIGIITLVVNYFVYAVTAFLIIVIVAVLIYKRKQEKNQEIENLELRCEAERGNIRAMEELSYRYDCGVSAEEALEWQKKANELTKRRKIAREKKEKQSAVKRENSRKRFEDLVMSKSNDTNS